MIKCEICGKEYSEEKIVKMEREGKIISVCEGCATGMKGFA